MFTTNHFLIVFEISLGELKGQHENYLTVNEYTPALGKYNIIKAKADLEQELLKQFNDYRSKFASTVVTVIPLLPAYD